MYYTKILASFIRQITKYYPLNSPRCSLIKLLPSIPDNYGEFSIKEGIKIAICSHKEDIISEHIFWFGDFDPTVNTTLKRLIDRGDTVVDIGANIGATSLVSALAVGDKGKVVCFEPIPNNFLSLQANVKANNLSNIYLEQLALSDSSGTVNMYIPTEQFGQAQITPISSINLPNQYEEINNIKKTTFAHGVTNDLKTMTNKVLKTIT